MTLDLNAIHADYEAWQKAHQSFDTDQWHLTANRLAGWVPDLLAALAVAERDRDEWQRRAELVQPVLDALKPWREQFRPASYMSPPAEVLAAAYDAFIAGPGGCAGHTRKPSEVERCVCSHTNHDYNGTTVKELNPDVDCPVHGEKACSHCGGMDGTHTIRDCAGHARAVAE